MLVISVKTQAAPSFPTLLGWSLASTGVGKMRTREEIPVVETAQCLTALLSV